MDRYQQLLQQYWGYQDFRGVQRQIIESIASGHDTLGLMPTGGGKSITFQVPALAADGVCIVITPLIALMKDQVEHLREKGIRAAAIHSGMQHSEILKVLENAVYGAVKLLYVSPERLSSELFQIKLNHMDVSFITVDEAHCISQWGYDFRPSYLKIADIRALKPDAPVLALTATATPQVMDDIMRQLHFHNGQVFRMSFARKNLSYVVRKTMDKRTELLHILRSVAGPAIVYVRSRARCKDTSLWLEQQGISSTFYHAGLEPAVKDQRQSLWQRDEKRVMVATNAFGMGIDKPDVRLVIHLDSPDSVEAYFQEAGRAGRDGLKAYAVLLWNGHDQAKLRARVSTNFPPKEFISEVYEHLAYYYEIATGSGGGQTFTFELDKFCSVYRYYPTYVDAALKLLQNAGYINYELDPEARARVMFLLGRDELYRLNELSPTEDAVITALLRNYGGLFIDYVYIDEALVAQQADMGQQQVYQVLKALTHKHILHFIPQRKTPYITYTRDRVDAVDVVIPKSVYEDRKEQYILRINAMIAYATNDHVCRSRQLLRYFGETTSHDCGICDVCVSQRHDPSADEKEANAEKAILHILSDGKRHHVRELLKLDFPNEAVDNALRFLLDEEMIHVDASFIYL